MPVFGSINEDAPASGSAAVDFSASSSVTASQDAADIGTAMCNYMMRELKWSHKELHDAVVFSGMTVPYHVSMLSYSHLLYQQFENKHHASLLQSGKIHTSKQQHISRSINT